MNNNTSFSSSSGGGGDDSSSEKSQAIPSTLIKEQWQLVLDQDATIPALINASDRCKELVFQSDECSEERKWLVRHLVELRYRLRELQDVAEDPDYHKSETKVILGHHFIPQQLKKLPKHKIYCDHCSGVIWSVVQASFVCLDCSFSVHYKCINNVLRICANIIASERNVPVEKICPEKGLASQNYKCAECATKLEFRSSIVEIINCFGKSPKKKLETTSCIEPRLCDYSGLYYCPTCHWNDKSMIPARIVHNWDFVPRKIGRASLQELNLLQNAVVINLEECNPKLFVYVHNLTIVKRLREDLNHMRHYLSECRFSMEQKFLEKNAGNERHLIQTSRLYSMSDLIAVENGSLIDTLNKLRDSLEKHIRNCQICMGKGYICEICNNNEPVFPFDDCSTPCLKCNSVYHRICFKRRLEKCEKCTRIDKRRIQTENRENGNIDD